MPKLTTTRTRTSDLGKPGIISTGEGNCGAEVMKFGNIFGDLRCTSLHTSIQDKLRHSIQLFRPLKFRLANR